MRQFVPILLCCVVAAAPAVAAPNITYIQRGDSTFAGLCERQGEPDPACQCLASHVRQTMPPKRYAGAATLTVALALASFYGRDRDRMASAMRTAERSLIEQHAYSTADIAAIRRGLADANKRCRRF
jgi:hypothetical protein